MMDMEKAIEEHLILACFTKNLIGAYCLDVTEDREILMRDQDEERGEERAVSTALRAEAEAFFPPIREQSRETQDLLFRFLSSIPSSKERAECLKIFSNKGLREAYELGTIHIVEEIQCLIDGHLAWAVKQAELFVSPDTGHLMAFLYTRNIDKQKKNERIMNAILSRSSDYVGLINVKRLTVRFQYLSESISKGAPHWVGREEIDFERDMFQSLEGFLLPEELEEVMQKTSLAFILSELQDKTVYTVTFLMHFIDGVERRKQVQCYWIDEFHEEILIIQTDITAAYEKELSNEKIRREAVTDPLTGLLNRRGLRTELDRMQKAADAAEKPFFLVMGDIDYFKRINDSYGHNAGDLVLQILAGLMREFVKDWGIVSRSGGEEFLFAIWESSQDTVRERLEDFRRKVREQVIMSGDQEIRVTMTFGLSRYDASTTLHDAVHDADMRLYYGKAHGRDQVVG